MPTLPSLPFHRRDPWWEVDGPAARREHRRRMLTTSVAFATAMVAAGGAAFVWSVELGLAAAVGVRVSLPFG